MNDNLKYFVNKVCTVLTQNATGNLRIEQKSFVDFFTGKVLFLDEQGIWLEHILTKTKSIFFYQSIVGIVEEQVLDENHPDLPAIREKIQSQKEPVKAQPVMNKAPEYVSMESLQKKSDELNKKYKEDKCIQ